jgi:hypothetical protein
VNSRKLRKNATRPAIADAAATLPGTAQGQYTLGA